MSNTEIEEGLRKYNYEARIALSALLTARGYDGNGKMAIAREILQGSTIDEAIYQYENWWRIRA